MSMTPTDSDMSSRFETDDNRGNRVDCLSQGKNHAIEKSNETFHRNNGQDSDKSLDSSPKNKLVRCYQPSSIFSYGSLFAQCVLPESIGACAVTLINDKL